MPSHPQDTFVVIDGNSLLYRAFYALPLLQNRRGEHTNAVYGFTGMLLKLLEEERPGYVAVAFDPPQPSFRVRIDSSYKAQREKTPPELGEQVRRAREVLAALRIPAFEVADFEADDVIGTLAERAGREGKTVTVVTGDADLLQLVDERITVLLTKKGISSMERYDRETFKDKYGLEPGQVVDYKALKGDPSDNIPGVPGIGEKTARSLIAEHGGIEQIYANLSSLREKVARNLEEYREQLLTGRELVTLRRDVPLEADWEQCRLRDPDHETLVSLFAELEFKSLLRRIKNPAAAADTSAETLANTEQLTGLGEIKALLETLGESSSLALLFEHRPGRPSWRQPLYLAALAVDRARGYYLDPRAPGLKDRELWAAIAAAAGRGAGLLVHNAKHLYHLFLDRDLKPPPVAFDTFLAAYLADPAAGGYDLTDLLQLHLGLDYGPPEKGKEEPDFKRRGPQLAGQARQLFALRESLAEILAAQNLAALLSDLELPLAEVLARMERRGMTVDAAYLQDLSAEICRRLEELEKEIHGLAGEEFNLNSPRQLSAILFDKLKLPEVRKTKTGRSTDARVLEELALHHEIAALLLHYRQLAKLEGTYLSGLIGLVDPDHNKIYTTFNQAVTATGRLSSSDPNLQNIPVRLEEGRRIRRAFVPSSPEKIFFAADYSQVELRVLAHLSGDSILVDAFKTGQDIHRRTAAEVNNISLDEVTPLMREKAKAVNFGIIYGSSDYGLAQGLKISRAEAKAYIDSYFERYSGVRAYMDRIIGEAADRGYVTTLLNRRRYLPEIHSANRNIRSFAERMALNTPIQGSAADIIKLAMLKIDQLINAGGFEAAMILQIHDELLFEIASSDLDFFAPLVRREMEGAFALSVPLKVDLKWGKNWEELKRL